MGTIVAMRRGEIGIEVVREGVGGGSALRVTQERRIRGVEHVADRLGEEVVLRLEVRVEAAVGESGTSHHLRHSDALCTLAPDCSGGFGEDAGACSLLVVVVVPHRFPELFTMDVSDNTTIRQLWSACRYTLAHFAGDSTCIDMMDIIQPNAPWIVA